MVAAVVGVPDTGGGGDGLSPTHADDVVAAVVGVPDTGGGGDGLSPKHADRAVFVGAPDLEVAVMACQQPAATVRFLLGHLIWRWL